MAPHPWRPMLHKRPRPDAKKDQQPSTEPQVPPAAYIQAYEARLDYSQAGPSTGSFRTTRREELIPWQGAEEGEEVLVDRYNILHLLPSLPELGNTTYPTHHNRASSPAPSSSSSSSWDDLPSDEEALFALSGDEARENYERKKKREWVERLRMERLKEMGKLEDDEGVGVDQAAGGNEHDEEPPEAIKILMHHTAKSIYASPNPKTLEMRILANHASDDRFIFLRGKGQGQGKGRWTEEWERVKRKVRVEMGLEKDSGAAVGLLGGYGSDSDDESDSEDEGKEGKGNGAGDGGAAPPDERPPSPPPPPEPDEATEVPLSRDMDNSSELPRPSSPTVMERNQQKKDHRILGEEEDSKANVALAENSEEEKRRLRRERLEEWKRNKGKGKIT